MKKLLILAVMCICGQLSVFSQESMTQKELQFRNGIERFLKEEGFYTTIDSEDNSVNFKKEGVQYWITVEGDTPYYIRLFRAGLSLDGENKSKLYEACNYANYNKRCAKACIGTSSVRFIVEYYCPSIEAFRRTFYRNIGAVDGSRDDVREYLNTH